MRIERRFLAWGLFFIALGAIPLLVQLGAADPLVVGRAWRVWPVLVIAAGLGLLLARSRLHVLAGLITAVTLGLIIGGGLAGGIGRIGCSGDGANGTSLPTRIGTFGASASVGLTINCGSATLVTTPGANWSFSGDGDPGRPPTIDSGPDHLTLHTGRAADLFDVGAVRSGWRLELPTDPILSVDLTVNAGSSQLDLAGARLGQLSLTANAGSVAIDLGRTTAIGAFDATVNAGQVVINLPALAMSGSVTVNAGRLRLCAPPGTGLRIETSGALAGNNFAQRGLSQDHNTWTTPGFETDPVQVELQVTVNAGNIELNQDGGCQ